MRRFLLGSVAVGTAVVFAGCVTKNSGDDDNGGQGAEPSTSAGGGGKAQAGYSGKGGKGGGPSASGAGGTGGSSGGSGGGGAVAGSLNGGSSGSGGDGAGGGSPGGGSSGAGTGGHAAGAAGAPEMPAGSGGEGGEASHDVGPPQQGSCTVPCQLELAPTGDLPGDSAVVVFDGSTATLTSDAQTSMNSEWVIGFSFEDDQHGYGAWSRNYWWFAFTEPLAYVEGSYSMAQDVEMTSQMINVMTNEVVIVTFSFGDHTVRVHDVHAPHCVGSSGACSTDCGPVDGGQLRPAAEECSPGCNGSSSCVASCVSDAEQVSVACADCYAAFLACVSEACPTDCPGQGGNACMQCETGADCHTDFMSCSGLDYMPRGTLTWPLYVP